MKNFSNHPSIIRFISSKWFVPLLLLGVSLLSYGILLPAMGLYWDDWPVVLLDQTDASPAEWLAFYNFDRPVSAWTYILFTPLLGSSPQAWQMFTLLLRWLTAWGMWAVLRQIWPQRQQAVTWMTLLFLVYPSFLLGAFSVAFSQHFITYALFFLSLLLMISAINNPRRALPLTIFGMFTALLHMATMEYMAGLEFVRPLIVWLLLGGVSLSRQERIKRMLKIWMPYLMVWLFFAVWRLVILEIPDDPNAPKLIYALQESPITALLGLVETILRHILYVLVTTWNRALDPYLIDLKSRFGMFTWGVMLFVLPSLYYIFSRERAITEKNNWEWQKNALILGLYSIIVGLLPVWFTGREIYTGRYSDRFSLPALFGASILLITIIYYFVSVNSRKVFIMSLLVTFAIGVQMRAINHYRWDWVYQQRFYWQLQWRAPGLKPQTGLVLEGLYSDYVASYAIAAAVNTLYPQINTEDQFLDYWVFGYVRQIEYRIPMVKKGMIMKDGLRTLNFQGNSKDMVVLFYGLEDQCVWFLSEDDILNEALPKPLRELAQVSNLSRILDAPIKEGYPSTTVFGKEPEPSWCTYYQKADLARQKGDWTQVRDLGKEAQSKGFKPDYGYEYLPFIQAHGAFEEWQQAADLSQKAYQRSKDVQLLLCAAWQSFAAEQGSNPGFERVYKEIHKNLACGGD